MNMSNNLLNSFSELLLKSYIIYLIFWNRISSTSVRIFSGGASVKREIDIAVIKLINIPIEPIPSGETQKANGKNYFDLGTNLKYTIYPMVNEST